MRYPIQSLTLASLILGSFGMYSGCATTENKWEASAREEKARADLDTAIVADDGNEAPGIQSLMVTRGKKKLPMTPGFKYQNGDIIELGEGRFKNILPVSEADIRVVGAGPDKTFLVGGINRTAIRVPSGSVFIENLQVVKPFISIGKTATVTFLNVQVVGFPQVSVEGFKESQYMTLGARVNFFYSEFAQEPEKLVSEKLDWANPFDHRRAYNVLYSRYKTRGGFKPYFFMLSNSEVEMRPMAKVWAEKGDIEQLFSVQNASLFNDDQLQVRILNNKANFHPAPKEELPALLSLIKTERTKYMGGKVVASKGEKTPEQYIKQSIQSKEKGNYFVELVSLMRAQQLAEGKLEAQIEKAIQKNRVELSKRYGCWTRFYDEKTKQAYNPSSIQPAYLSVAVNKVSKVLTVLGSKDSNCVLQANVVKEFFLGMDSREQIDKVEQQWKEDPATTRMKDMYERAAKQAAEDASKARFTSSLDRLTSTAKQLQANRNRIEDRADGTYLVVNNKKLKNSAASDEQAYKNKMGQSKDLQAKSDSAGNKMLRAGVLTKSSYYRTYQNEIRYDLSLKNGNKQAKYSFPLESKNYNVGPCHVEEDSGTAHFAGLKALSDTCGQKSYFPDSELRKNYIERYLELPTQEFVVAEVLPALIQEVQKKQESKQAEANLDGMILAQLMSGGDGSPEMSEKSKGVLGESISMKDLRDLIFFSK